MIFIKWLVQFLWLKIDKAVHQLNHLLTLNRPFVLVSYAYYSHISTIYHMQAFTFIIPCLPLPAALWPSLCLFKCTSHTRASLYSTDCPPPFSPLEFRRFHMQLSSFRRLTSAGSLNVFHSQEGWICCLWQCHISSFSDTKIRQFLSILNQTDKIKSVSWSLWPFF